MQSMQFLNGTIALDSVLRTQELNSRPSRPPDHAAETAPDHPSIAVQH